MSNNTYRDRTDFDNVVNIFWIKNRYLCLDILDILSYFSCRALLCSSFNIWSCSCQRSKSW